MEFIDKIILSQSAKNKTKNLKIPKRIYLSYRNGKRRNQALENDKKEGQGDGGVRQQ